VDITLEVSTPTFLDGGHGWHSATDGICTLGA
jgi:hypothetical protein